MTVRLHRKDDLSSHVFGPCAWNELLAHQGTAFRVQGGSCGLDVWGIMGLERDAVWPGNTFPAPVAHTEWTNSLEGALGEELVLLNITILRNVFPCSPYRLGLVPCSRVSPCKHKWTRASPHHVPLETDPFVASWTRTIWWNGETVQ